MTSMNLWTVRNRRLLVRSNFKKRLFRTALNIHILSFIWASSLYISYLCDNQIIFVDYVAHSNDLRPNDLRLNDLRLEPKVLPADFSYFP